MYDLPGFRRNVLLVAFGALAWIGDAVDLHVGMMGPFSGPWSNRGVQFLEVADYAMNFLATKKSNNIAGTNWNIILHHCDHHNDGDFLEGIAAKFALGTATMAECQKDWQYSSWTNKITGASGVEPAMAPMDVLLYVWGSGYVVRMLGGLKTAGIRIPSYCAGTNGLGAWVNDDGTARWDFAVNSGEVIADGEMRPCIMNLAQKRAKSIVFVEMANAGSWTSSLCDGGRSQSKEDGIEILADAVLDFKDCGFKIFPEGAEKAAFDACYAENVKMLEDAVGHVLYSGNKYSADALALCTYPDICSWLPTYLKEKNINFGSIIGYRCHDSKISKEEKAKYTSTEIGEYTWDYWLHYQFLPGAKGVFYNQKHNPDNIGIFAEYGESSSTGLWKEMQKMRGLDTTTQGGYQESLMFNSWEMLFQDLVRVKGDKSQIIAGFNAHRPVLTSHWGPLSAVPAGYSSMHMPTVLQQFPAWQHDGKAISVGPEAVAQAVSVFPAPFWNKRACEDKCVRCPKCDELVSLQIPILLSCFGPTLIFAAIAFAVGNKANMSLILTYLGMAGAFMANLATDVLAIMTILYQMEEEIIDRNAVIPYIYGIFTVLGLLVGISRVKIQMAGAYMAAYGTPTPVDISYMSQLDSLSVICSAVFADTPTFIVQAITCLVFAPSEPLIISMILTGMTLGYAGAAPESIKDSRQYVTTMIELADLQKLPLPAGTEEYNKPVTSFLSKVLNPCDFKMGLTVGGARRWSVVAAEKNVQGEDKSI